MEHTKSGFSLIEILIALAIVGMMAAGGFSLLRYLDRAKVTKTKTQLAAVQSAVEQYQASTNRLPDKLEDLISRPQNVKGWSGPYVNDENDLKDNWGHPFYYRPNSKGSAQAYELYSYGTKEGEESDENKRIDVWSL